MLMDANTMLKPLQSKGALLDRNHAGNGELETNKELLSRELKWLYIFLIFLKIVCDSLVRGLIASGESRLATDCTPATKPCAFP